MFSIYSIANQNKTAAQLLAKGGSGNLTSQNYSSQNSKNQANRTQQRANSTIQY